MSAEDPDQPVMIMAPYISHLESKRALPGSRVIRADCGHFVWCSAQGERFLIEHPNTLTICLVCRPRKVTAEYTVPGALEAAEAAFGADGGDVVAFRQFIQARGFKEWTG